MPNLFARITKVDEERRTVTGRAAQEVVDRDNEIFDYASSKPNFMKWSTEVHADSDGKSLGNVRAMHGQIAAGKLTDIQFLDSEQAIDVEAKIIDDNEWNKVLEGVYTGFSIGGRYTRKWTDTANGKVVNRYTASPTELSLVDRPCIPTARFYEVHKADGTVLQKLFKFADAEAVAAAVAKFDMPTGPTTGLQGYDQEGTKPKKRKAGTPMASSNAGDDQQSEPVSNAGQPGAKKRKSVPASDYDEDANDDTADDIPVVDAAGDGVGKGECHDEGDLKKPKVGKTKPQDEEDDGDEDDADKADKADTGDLEKGGPGSGPRPGAGRARDMSDHDLPKSTAKQQAKLSAAAWAATAKTSFLSSRGHAKAFLAHEAAFNAYVRGPHGPGTREKMSEHRRQGQEHDMHLKLDDGDMQKGDLQKGVEGVASLAALACQLKYLADGQCYEREAEGDDSDLPEKLRAKAADLLALVSQMAKEEGEELATGDDTPNPAATLPGNMVPGLYRSDVSEFAKALRTQLGMDELAKEGRRNSTADLSKIQTIHDATCELGACCAGPKSHDGDSISNEESTMAVEKRADTISSEARARGTSVSDPSAAKPAPESDNAADKEPIGSAGQEKRKARKDEDEDEDEARDESKKRKARKDEDEDEDFPPSAKKGKKRMDEDEDEDFPPAKKGKARKDEDEDDAEAFPPQRGGKGAAKFDQAALAEAVAKAVASVVPALLESLQKSQSAQEVSTVAIPRTTPNLFAVGKDGGVEKVASSSVQIDTLRKSVASVPGDRDDAEDRGTATLIKALRARGPTITGLTHEQIARLEAGLDI